MRLFMHQPFTMGAIVAFVYGIGLFGSTYLLPIYLQAALDYRHPNPASCCCPRASRSPNDAVAGRLADKLRASRLVAGGLALLVTSTVLTATVSPATSILVLMTWGGAGPHRHRRHHALAQPGFDARPGTGRNSAGRQHGEFPQAARRRGRRKPGGILLEWRLAAHGATLLGTGGGTARMDAFAETFLLLAAITAPAMVAGWFMEAKKRR